MNEELKSMFEEIKRTVRTYMKTVWSVSDLALDLGISESRVRHMANDRVIPSYKQNGSLYFKREEIEDWKLRNRTASISEVEAQAATYCAVRRMK